MTSRKVNIQESLWDKKESAYGTAINDAEAGAFSDLFEGTPFDVTPRVGDDRQESGKGHEWRGDKRILNGWDATVARDRIANARLLGWLLSFGFGSVSSADNGDGSYKHTLKPLDPASAVQIPSTSIVENQPDEGLKRKLSGICVNDLSLSAGKGQWLRAAYNLVGNGKADSSTAHSMPSSVIACSPIRFTDINVGGIGNSGGGLTDILSRLRGFTFNYNNNLRVDDGELANSPSWNGGPLKGKLEIGDRELGLELILDAARGSHPEYDRLIGSTLSEVKLVCRGALIAGSNYEELQIRFPECHIDAAKPAFDGPVKTYTLQVTPRYESGIASPIDCYVQNDAPAYLVAAGG